MVESSKQEAGMAETKTQDREVLFALEGERKPRSLAISAGATVSHFLEQVKTLTGRADLEEVMIEDDEMALEGHHVLTERIVIDEFRLVHVATKGKIKVVVTFNGKTKDHEFRPNATMEKIVKWAMKAFDLEGDPSDFQLKLGDDLLPPGLHLGQVAEGKKTVRLALVMKIKPQG
jgi:hypothetical protein